MSATAAALPLPTPLLWVRPKLTDHGTLLAMANVAGSVVPAVAAILQIGVTCIVNPQACGPH